MIPEQVLLRPVPASFLLRTWFQPQDFQCVNKKCWWMMRWGPDSGIFQHIQMCEDIYIYYICVYILYLYIHIRKFVSMYQFSGRLATFWYCTVFNCYQGSLVWKTWSATKTTATCVIGEKVCETDATKTSTVVWFMIVFDIVCLLYERDGLMHLAPHVKGWVETESFCTQW